MADITPLETLGKAVADCASLQLEQLQVLAPLHNPLDGVDLSEPIARTIEMQADLNLLLVHIMDAMKAPAPRNKMTLLAPPPPFVNEDKPSVLAELKEFFKNIFFKN